MRIGVADAVDAVGATVVATVDALCAVVCEIEGTLGVATEELEGTLCVAVFVIVEVVDETDNKEEEESVGALGAAPLEECVVVAVVATADDCRADDCCAAVIPRVLTICASKSESRSAAMSCSDGFSNARGVVARVFPALVRRALSLLFVRKVSEGGMM